MISGSTITILIYLKRLYDRLSKCITFVVLGPVISEKSSNENGHILPRMSGNQKMCSGVSFNDFSVINGPKITILIYLKRTYKGLSRYMKYVVLSPIMYKCNLYDVLWLRW